VVPKAGRLGRGVENTRVCEHELVDDALFLLYPFAGASRRRLVAARTARRAAPAARPERARLTTDTHLRARPPLPSTHDGRDRELRDGDARTPPLLGHRSVARRAQARRRREGAQGTRRSDVSRRFPPSPNASTARSPLSLLPPTEPARDRSAPFPPAPRPRAPTPRARSKGKGLGFDDAAIRPEMHSRRATLSELRSTSPLATRPISAPRSSRSIPAPPVLILAFVLTFYDPPPPRAFLPLPSRPSPASRRLRDGVGG
jgi:hypothetical protein